MPSYNPSPRSTSIRLDREVDIQVNVWVNDKVSTIIEAEVLLLEVDFKMNVKVIDKVADKLGGQ